MINVSGDALESSNRPIRIHYFLTSFFLLAFWARLMLTELCFLTACSYFFIKPYGFLFDFFSQNISEISLKNSQLKTACFAGFCLVERERERVKWSKRQQHQTNIWWRHRPLLHFGGFEGGGNESPTEHDIIIVVRSKMQKIRFFFIAIFRYSRISVHTYVWTNSLVSNCMSSQVF